MPYDPTFIGYKVPLPIIRDTDLIAPLKGGGTELEYLHHSVIMNRKRRFAFYAASNIDGKTWDPVDRKGSFRKDDRMDEKFQFGDELYDAISGGGRPNDFDEGHLTSYQEVLWGKEKEQREKAGSDTFHFTNCVPQHGLLNRGVWKSLEQVVTKTGASKGNINVSVMTGPVFVDTDPYYIKKIEGQKIRIPITFWKVIFYNGISGPSALGFLMNHKKLLLDDGTVTYDESEIEERDLEEDIMKKFPKATTYQVEVKLIEKMTNLNFNLDGITLPYKQTGNENKELLFKRIEIEPKDERGLDEEEELDYRIEGLVL